MHDIAEHYLFSFHMIQHLLLSLVFPPLILCGMPAWMLRYVLKPRGIGVARVLTKPLIALVAFNAVIAITHIPNVVHPRVDERGFHFGMHCLLVGTAFMMWSPVLNPLIELPKLSYPPTDDVPVPAITGADRAGVVPDVRAHGAVPRVPARARPALRDLRDERPTVRRTRDEASRDGDLVGLHRVYFFKWFAVEERENIDVLEWSKLDKLEAAER